MPDIFLLKAVVRTLVLPPTGPLLLALCGLVLMRWRPRAGRAIATGAVVLLLVLAVPFVAERLTQLLDPPPELDLEQARGAQAIVILGGGVRRNAVEFGGDTVGRYTLERVRYGARVARLTGLPVVVTGGTVLGGEPEGKLMRDSLEKEFGVPVTWVEQRSRNTHENAQFTAAMLAPQHVSRIVLVAHGADMARARAEFTAAGFSVIPAATFIAGDTRSQSPEILDFLPGLGGLQESYHACYELLARLVLALTR